MQTSSIDAALAKDTDFASPGEKDEVFDMHCANCSEKIMVKPLKQDSELFCSLECANLASGIEPEEALEDVEDSMDKRFEDYFSDED